MKKVYVSQKGLFTHLPVFRVHLVRERDFSTAPIITPEDAARVLCEFFEGSDRERLVVMMLATSGACIGINVASVGTLAASLVSPREVFKPAILGQAASIIVSHNHPSGNLTPSREDIKVTKTLVDAGKLLDIPVRDHIICGYDGKYVSLAEQGLM